MRKLIYFVAAAFCALAFDSGCALETSKSGARPGMSDGAHPRPEGRGARGSSSDGSRSDGKAASTMAEIIVTNGASINGPLINGKAAPGSEVHGRKVAGTSAGGRALSGITLQGSGLTTVRVSDGAVLSGAALIGATFATHMPERSRITLRIDAHSASPSDHHAGSTLHRYALSYRPSGAAAWLPVCGERDGKPVLAIPLVGRWSYEQGVPGGGARLDEPDWITFACSELALYKCVRLGYEPWTSAGGVRLDGHHQACLRAHRADYCGDGRAYAVDRHFINIFDKLGIQDDTASWSLESEWDANGARCLSRPRLEGGPALDCARSRCEAAPDWGHTLVVTEAP